MAAEDIVERNRRLVAAAYAPRQAPQPRLTRPVPSTKAVEFSFGGGGAKPKTEQGDKGILSGLAAIVPSAVKGIGAGVAAIPQFVGKGVQTGIGFGEGLIDLGADIINEDLYTSRFETDLARGKELGLTGEDLMIYSTQRQYPLGSMIYQGMSTTAKNLGEVATLGQMDFGEKGLNYANAFRRGDLGEMLVGDVGNVVMIGRGLGAGNVVAKGGAAIAKAGMPRLGRAVATAGRFSEEPIAETVRQGARLVERGAGTARPSLAGAARRIYTNVADNTVMNRPIRQLVNEVGQAWYGRNLAAAADLFEQASNLEDMARSMPDGPEKTRIGTQINDLREQAKQKSAVGSGVVKRGKRTVWKMTVATERAKQMVVSQFQRMQKYGSIPESPEQLRRTAAKWRKRADAPDMEPTLRDQLRRQADDLDERANIKEQFPQYFDQELQPWVQQAAPLVLTGLGRVAQQMAETGYSDAEIAATLQSPDVTPALEGKGMGITEEGVRAAREFMDVLDGKETPMDAGAALAIRAYLELYQAFDEQFSRAMRQGFGLPEGPMPETYFGWFPVPEFLMSGMERWPDQLKFDGRRILDYLAAEAIYESVQQGHMTPEAWAELGVNYKGLLDAIDRADITEVDSNPFAGLYAKLASSKHGSVGYEYAAIVSQSAFAELRKLAPEQMMDKSIYPSRLRPVVEAQGRMVRVATANDMAMMGQQLARLVSEFENEIPKKIVGGALRDIERMSQPGEMVSKSAWLRTRKRITTILQSAIRERDRLIAAGAKLDEAAEQNVLELERAIDALTSADRLIRTVVDVSRKEDIPPAMAEAQAVRETAEADIAGTQQELLDLQAELDELTADLPETTATRRPELDRLDTEVADRVRERDRLEGDMLDADALDEADIENLKMERDFVARAEEAGQVVVPEPTPQQLKQARAEAVTAAEKAVSDASDVLRAKYHGQTVVPGTGVEFYSPEQRTYTYDTPTGPKTRKFTVSGSKRQYKSAFLPRAQFEIEDVYSPFMDGLQRAGVTGYMAEKLLKKFKDEFTIKSKYGLEPAMRIDQVAQAAAEVDPALRATEGTEATPDRAYLEELGKAYGDYEMARRKLADTRRTKPDDYYEEARAKLEKELNPLSAPELSGRSSAELSRVIDLAENPEAMSAALDQVVKLEQDINQLRNNIAELEANPILTARTRTPEEVAVLEKIAGRRSRLRTQLKKLEEARRKEVAQIRKHIKSGGRQAMRARLKGVGNLAPERTPGRFVLAVEPGQPVLNKDVERKLNDTPEQLANKQKNIDKKIEDIREQQAAQETVISAADRANATPRQRDYYTSAEFLVGPELFNPETDTIGYFPVGPTRQMRPAARIQTQILGEGAGAQNEPSFARQRRGTSLVLTANDAAAKLMEITGQMYHNATVEEILRDPQITSSVNKVLGEEWWSLNEQQVRNEVEAQPSNALRTADEIEAAVKADLGDRAIRELKRRGYEPVSRVEVDPDTGAHAAVGTLDEVIDGRAITPETFVMRQGVRERLFAEYTKKGAKNVPAVIERILGGIGKVQGKWKSVILPISLRWQIGDAVSNVLNAWLRGGVKPTEMRRAMQEVVKRMTDEGDASLGNLFFGDILQEAAKDPVISAILGAGLQGRGIRLDELIFAMKNSDEIIGSFQDPVARTTIGRYFNRFRSKAFRLNEAQNTIARTAIALIKLEENLAKAGRTLDDVNGVAAMRDPQIMAALSDAVNATNDALGSFSELTPWEKSVMRQIFPFWSWIKFINKAAMELAIDSPDRVLFYSHLGSMAADPDQNGLMDFLRGKTPVGPYLFDLNFLNPYQDAFILDVNPITATAEQFTSISPAIAVPLQMGTEAYYGLTGRELPFLGSVSRPGYLEGRPGATSRTLGDTLGGMAYIGLKGLGGPFRNVLDVLPRGTIPGTDIATGSVNRFPQGSARTSGIYAQPRLSPVVSKLSAVGRTFGIPSPIIETETAIKQSKLQAQRDKAARLRRIKERKTAEG